jgi:anti-sigma B factor antagonist
MRFARREVILNSHLLNLSGPLNINRSEYVVQLFRDLSERGIKRVVVNLEDVPFIDSHGLGALIAGYKIFGRNPQNFRLTGIQDQPLLVFELTGFDHVFGTSEHLGEKMAVSMAATPLQVLPGAQRRVRHHRDAQAGLRLLGQV